MAYETIALGNAGVLAPGRWRWLRALGWMVLLFVAVIAVASLPMLAHRFVAPRTADARALALLAALIGYLVYAGLVRVGEKRWPREIAPSAMARDLLTGVPIGVGMFALVFASLRLMGAYTLARGHWDSWATDLAGASLAGFVEELAVRAIVFRLLMRAAGPWWALAISALMFGGMHLANPHATAFAALAIAIQAGLMLAAFYLLTGRIWMSVGIHIAWNFTQGSVFGARVSGTADHATLFTSAPVPGSPDLLSGGAFGPEASLSAIVAGAVIFAVVLRAARRARRV